MFAVFYDRDLVVGYKEIIDENEEETFQLSYDKLDAIPDILQDTSGNYKFVRESVGVYTKVALPPAPPTKEDELADLKQRTEDLEILIAEIITGG
jgi:hypothetical protein